MPNEKDSDFFDRIFNAFGRVERALSQQGASQMPDNDEENQKLVAENIRLREAAAQAIAEMDSLMARNSGGAG